MFVCLDLELEVIIFQIGLWKFWIWIWIVLRIDMTITRGVGSIGYCYILCEYILQRDPKLKKFVVFLDGCGRSWRFGDVEPRRLVTVFLLVVLLLFVWCLDEMDVCSFARQTAMDLSRPHLISHYRNAKHWKGI